MLRDVVVHIHNEQPLLADLPASPTAGDWCLVCTNLRATNGKPPTFVERSDSTFVIPLAHIRFIEIRAASVETADVALLPATAGPDVDVGDDLGDADQESVDVLRRLRGE